MAIYIHAIIKLVYPIFFCNFFSPELDPGVRVEQDGLRLVGEVVVEHDVLGEGLDEVDVVLGPRVEPHGDAVVGRVGALDLDPYAHPVEDGGHVGGRPAELEGGLKFDMNFD